jgi:hypothetical protein
MSKGLEPEDPHLGLGLEETRRHLLEDHHMGSTEGLRRVVRDAEFAADPALSLRRVHRDRHYALEHGGARDPQPGELVAVPLDEETLPPEISAGIDAFLADPHGLGSRRERPFLIQHGTITGRLPQREKSHLPNGARVLPDPDREGGMVLVLGTRSADCVHQVSMADLLAVQKAAHDAIIRGGPEHA